MNSEITRNLLSLLLTITVLIDKSYWKWYGRQGRRGGIYDDDGNYLRL